MNTSNGTTKSLTLGMMAGLSQSFQSIPRSIFKSMYEMYGKRKQKKQYDRLLAHHHYSMRVTGTTGNDTLLEDFSGKPYRMCGATGKITREFDKGESKKVRAKRHRQARRERVIAVCDYFLAPRNYTIGKRRLAGLEQFIADHKEVRSRIGVPA